MDGPKLRGMVKANLQDKHDREPVRKWAKVRLWAGYIYVLCAVIFAKPHIIGVAGGTVLILSGIAVRLIASGTLVKDRELCMSGIYAMTRNPLYFGSALIGLGYGVLSWTWWIVGMFFIILAPMYVHMINLEERYMEGLFPEMYPEYREGTPRFFPNFRKADGLIKAMEWGKLKSSGELISALLFIALGAILLIWHIQWLTG